MTDKQVMQQALDALVVEQTAVIIERLVPKPHLTNSIAALRAAIAQPEQPAAAWRERAIFLIYYDDQDQRPEILIGEAVGRARFKTVGMSWNAHLFVKVASNSHDDSYANNNAPMFYDTIAQPVQPAERNFCARCGKRLFSDGIHTCTPPKSTK